MSDSKVFVFRVTSTVDDFENYGPLFVTMPMTMETTDFIAEHGEWVLRMRNANILPEKFSSLGIAMDATIWWDSQQATYEMDDEARVDFIDKLHDEILEHEVVIGSETTLRSALRFEKLPAVARFYIDGEGFMVSGVLPFDEGHYCGSGLLTRDNFREAITRSIGDKAAAL